MRFLYTILLAALLITTACDDGAGPATAPAWSFQSPLDDGSRSGVHVRWKSPDGAACADGWDLVVITARRDKAYAFASIDGGPVYCDAEAEGQPGLLFELEPGGGAYDVRVEVWGIDGRTWAADALVPAPAPEVVVGVDLVPELEP